MAVELCWFRAVAVAVGFGEAEIVDNERKSIKNQAPKASNMSAPIADQKVVLRLISPCQIAAQNKAKSNVA